MNKLPDALIQRLQQNEDTLRKFHEIELSILSILDFKDFFERLLTQISIKFSIPHTWLSVIETSSIFSQVRSIAQSQALETSICFISKNDFFNITAGSPEPILANTAMHNYDFMVPPDAAYDIGSIAITPISLDGEIIGSINQADKNIYRFEPGIDTSLLAQLGLKVSLCLSNVYAHEQLKFLAYHDPLTGLLNRRVMERILEREFLRARRYSTDLSVAMLDLDDFKQINDIHGHDQGDQALIHLSCCLKQMKRDSDIVARFAGDEFVIILPSTSPQQAASLVERIQVNLKDRPLATNTDHITIRLSYGIASAMDKHVTSAADLLKSADRQLYALKKQKKTLSLS